MADCNLADRRVLVVEDDFFLADELCRNLEEAGVVVLGPAPTVSRALEIVAEGAPVDAAVLDVNLGGEMAFAVADALLARSVPVVFTSGYEDGMLKQRYPGAPRCQKPAEFATIARALMTVLST